jgi:hypothetical protein
MGTAAIFGKNKKTETGFVKRMSRGKCKIVSI